LNGKKFIAKQNSNGLYFMITICIGFVITNVLTKVAYKPLSDIAAVVTTIVAFDYIIIHGIKKNKLLVKLADISYTLYLNHLPILLICYCFFSMAFHKLIFFERYPYYISIVIATGLCYFIYLLVEKKSLSIIKSVKSYWKNK
jgi:peptidoglycan/LPS O-acetylase OafA/YrhL